MLKSNHIWLLLNVAAGVKRYLFEMTKSQVKTTHSELEECFISACAYSHTYLLSLVQERIFTLAASPRSTGLEEEELTKEQT
ncbi:hypothetical protein SODALDRAFT_356460 [Sodiomyces alkalinus F11]|uniref:Uncharacterized protein n=1 Tax=Sodiomyces alkalinus (strain CBS 110278 / VKM F-3762 / F11) TaxID=1314773 RepID=A0A3N2Q168_SODAK|nr:hypothetical protein SODALDRAFT_356460 [Sodiomyces alkalinus F11]ROT40472.1 hypothetical protein SODALDRAFT_356460 [Sodiomyces alkalinus F11]